MVIKAVTDSIGLFDQLLQLVLSRLPDSIREAAGSIQCAEDLLGSEHSAEEIAASAIAVEESLHWQVSHEAFRTMETIGYIGDPHASGRDSYPDETRAKALTAYTCYVETKKDRLLKRLFGRVDCLEYGMHDPMAIAERLVAVFGGSVDRSLGDRIVIVEGLPWGKMKFMPIGERVICSGSEITFQTGVNRLTTLDNLRQMGVQDIQEERSDVLFTVRVEYENDRVDHVDFRMVFTE